MKKLGLIAFLLPFMCACTKDEQSPVPESGISKLVINEFMAANLNSYEDPENTGDYDDWIEIYNMGTTPVNIAGLYISDNKAYKTKYKIPATDAAKTTVPAGGYLILWADSELNQGANHLDFKLSADGEDLGLYTADGKVIDEVTFGAQTTDVSFGRQESGSNNWMFLPKSSPGWSNKGLNNK